MSHVAKEEKIQSQSWSDLPFDILKLIMDRLYYADQFRFRAVCKRWSSIYGDKYADKLSWVMAYECHKNEIVCEFYDPSHSQKYTIKHSIRKKERGIFDGAEVCVSKHGWVLFSKTQPNTGTTSFFFYAPFSGEIMELPKFLIKGFKAATFSTSPASVDCVVCVLCTDDKKLSVSTCSPRGKIWKKRRFDGFGDGKVEYNVMTFLDGTIYWIFSHGMMGAFNIALQEFNMIGPILPKCASSAAYLVESDGHILLVYHGYYDYLTQEYGGDQWYIFRFDQLQKNWIAVESLDNQLLFVGSTLLLVPAEGEASKLANTVHLDGTECKSYYHKAGGADFPQIYDCFENNGQRKIWIQPPQSKA